jgi:hypothetical protein
MARFSTIAVIVVALVIGSGCGGPSSQTQSTVSPIPSIPYVFITPTTQTVIQGGTYQFVAVASPTSRVSWSIREGSAGGTITSNGLYSGPDQIGTFHVVATSVANTSTTAVAVVTVVASGGFAKVGSMEIGRIHHTATLIPNGKVLIAGGNDGQGNSLATAELFDPATKTFSPTANMNSARSLAPAVLLPNGKVLIVGGGDNAGNMLATAEIYDPSSASFSPTGSMSTPRLGATATLLASGKVLVTGGFGPGTSELPRLNSAELYDPATGTFSSSGDMSVPRILHTAVLLSDGKVLVAGGTTRSGGGGAATASADLYDPQTNAFTPAKDMMTDRAQLTGTLLANGAVLIVGGWNGHRADGSDDPPWDPLFAELFNPVSKEFGSTGSMSTTRIGHTSNLLLDGTVLVIGGVPNLQNLHEQPVAPQSAELFSLASGAFGPTGGLLTERSYHTATVLPNGQVLVTGGVDVNGKTLATAELYGSQ